ncbi:hypothetical protein N7495_009325 [Penicillium taxi]|uniref:uncharacterized protein n=1 Tax=Penicillium taxi TaxID=168475 RepID=UPI0025455382|nr:uncharacterized protein N7495_009325 [Penicillium taxi]KAJ5884815.1 hypothetical protein N7495_009325 [Penicillium taxi]
METHTTYEICTASNATHFDEWSVTSSYPLGDRSKPKVRGLPTVGVQPQSFLQSGSGFAGFTVLPPFLSRSSWEWVAAWALSRVQTLRGGCTNFLVGPVVLV